MTKHPVPSIRSNDGQRDPLGLHHTVLVRKAHGAGVERGNLITVKIRSDEALRRVAPGNVSNMRPGQPQAIQPVEVGASIVADGGHDQRGIFQQTKVVGDISSTSAELAAQFWHQKCEIQDVNLMWQDVVAKAITKDHDRIVGH